MGKVMEERQATYEEVKQMKINKVLEMPWECLDENDYIYFFEKDHSVCAAIRLSEDPCDDEIIWIDEFEIVREYRNQGIGKLIICDFLETCDCVVKLLAKNKSVAEFWHKCGFQYANPSWAGQGIKYLEWKNPETYYKFESKKESNKYFLYVRTCFEEREIKMITHIKLNSILHSRMVFKTKITRLFLCPDICKKEKCQVQGRRGSENYAIYCTRSCVSGKANGLADVP